MNKDGVNYKKISAYYLFATLFGKGMAFFTVPVFTRVFSTSDYGIVNTYNSWVAILSMTIGFTLHMGVRAAFVDYRQQINDFMSTIVSFTIVFAITICIAVYGFLSIKNISSGLILLCIVQSVAGALISDYSMYLMMQYRFKLRTIIMVLPDLLAVIASIVTVIYIIDDNLYLGRIVPTAFIYVIFGVAVSCLVYMKRRPVIYGRFLKYGLGISAPLILHGISLTLLSQSDRTMITWLADSSQTGIYSLIYNFSMLAIVVTTAFDGIWVPWFTDRMIECEYDKINKMGRFYLELIALAISVLVLTGPEIVKILASSDYWEGINIIPPIVLSNFAIFAYTLYVNIEHYYKKTMMISINTLTSAIVNIFLNALLIPRYGYVAAAYTTLISYILAFYLHKKSADKLVKELFDTKMFVVIMCELGVITFFFYLLLDFWIIRWVICIFYLVIKQYTYRYEIKSYIMKRKNR